MVELARAALQREGAGPWKVWVDGPWCYARPSAHRLRRQGWKLHLAATRSSATAVLERTLALLAGNRCAFKFANSLEQVRLLNSRHYPRGGAGKFLTAYPDDDEHFRHLARELDRATDGLAGPAILSDRPLRPGSLVHYRYGGFAAVLELSNDGDYRTMLAGPDGSLVEDRRDAWFSAPAWAPAPLAGDADAPEGAATAPAERDGRAGGEPRPVLLGGRFVVRQAIRHANKGGVFRALDNATGAEVVVKQARPHVEADEAGRDARDGLRHEAAVLDRLAPLRVAPRKLALFEQDGHLFLAEELLPGAPLRRWVEERCDHQPGLALPPALELARRLTALLAAVHGAGLVLRDLTPNNLIVAPDGVLRLVDLELATPPLAPAVIAGTPAYAAPEQLEGAPPATTADLYSLGAVLFLLATGGDPAFLEDLPPLRPTVARVAAWLEAVAAESESARALAPLILGLMGQLPERRWPLARAGDYLEGLEREGRPEPAGPAGGARAGADLDRLIEDALDHLLATMTPGRRERLWPSTCFGGSTEPCNVQHGAGGVIAVLAMAARLDLASGERLRAALRGACAWVERRLPNEPRVLPGLYFGRSGTAWALHDAAAATHDEGLAARALALAKRLPVTWPNPDVAHGAAGAGLAHLHLWQASRDGELGRRLVECADGLVAAARRDPSGADRVLWPVPAAFDSRFAGGAHYGFAHGVAGIGWFLLATGLATGRGDYLALAAEAGETLAAAAQREDGAAWWGSGPDDRASRLPYWCSGAAGVGTFLVRLARASGQARASQLAEQAAVAARRVKWHATPAACHGLAGNGEFLLDMALLLDEPRYRAWAEELAGAILARHAYRGGRMVVPDDSGTAVAADYGVGLAGVLAFLLRLRHGGGRLWMADLDLEAATAGHAGVAESGP
jgi:hypothetical protein